MKKLILIIFLTGVFFSCNDERLEELNRPKKSAVEVPAETLFANAARELVDMQTTANVNENNFRLYAQYWAQTTYPDESQYNQVTRNLPDNIFVNGYRETLKDLQEAKTRVDETWELSGLSEQDRDTQIALIEVLEVYTYSVLADIFGAIPYTEALDETNLAPKYDLASDVYAGIIVELNDAITKLNAGIAAGAAGFDADQDLLYAGDIEGWLAFANSLKVRLAVTISDVDAGKAQSMLTEALAGGIFASNADNASMDYLPGLPNTNPLFEDLVQSGRHDFVIANTIVDIMQDDLGGDPRLAVYADPTDDGLYIGGEYGTANNYLANSHVGALYHEPTLEGVLLDYSEINFLLAEAAAKGLNVGATAEEFYNEGIRASFDYWGVADVDAYLAKPEVAYATAAGTWQQKIGIQEWIALYNRGFEGWNVWRRLDFEGFNVPDGLTEADIPRRIIFPIKEATLNPSSLDAAIQLIGGSDDVQTKVFWDVN
jgi:hypothetical protein